MAGPREPQGGENQPPAGPGALGGTGPRGRGSGSRPCPVARPQGSESLCSVLLPRPGAGPLLRAPAPPTPTPPRPFWPPPSGARPPAACRPDAPTLLGQDRPGRPVAPGPWGWQDPLTCLTGGSPEPGRALAAEAVDAVCAGPTILTWAGSTLIHIWKTGRLKPQWRHAWEGRARQGWAGSPPWSCCVWLPHGVRARRPGCGDGDPRPQVAEPPG